MIKPILGSLIVLAASFSHASDREQARALSAKEIEARNAVASSGQLQISMKMKNRIVNDSGRERKLIVAGHGIYRLVENSANECQSAKMEEMKVDSGFFKNKTEISQYSTLYELSTDDSEEIEIPRLAFARYLDSGLFSTKEVICYYELTSASIAPAIEVGLLTSSNSTEIPISILPSAETVPEVVSLNIGMMTIGWHGTYPMCKQKGCQIPAILGGKTSVLLNYDSSANSSED